jgi:hypothetical protein
MKKPDLNEIKRSNVIALFKGEDGDLVRSIESRNYRLPKGYISWGDLSALGAISIFTADESFRYQLDGSSYLYNHAMASWTIQDAPLYCITPELFKAFQETNSLEKPLIMAGWKPVLPFFVIAISKGLLISPDGGIIDFLVVACGDSLSRERLKWKNKVIPPLPFADLGLYFQWGTTDVRETCWFSSTVVEPDGSLSYQTENSYGKTPMNEQDRVFVEEVRNIIINVLLSLSYSPSLFAEMTKDEQLSLSPKKGFAPSKKEDTVRYPKWIGKNYQHKSSRQSSQSSHGSPKRQHWRIGHWRVYEPGEGLAWKEYKVIWIQPCLITGGDD